MVISVDIYGEAASTDSSSYAGEHWCIGIGTEEMSNEGAAERQRSARALAASNAVVGDNYFADPGDYAVLDPPDTFAGWQTRSVSYTATAQDAGKEIVVFLSGGFLEVGSDRDTCFDNATFVRKPLDPAQAAGPQPANGEAEVRTSETLGWTPGIDADTHDVYFGTVLEDVNDADRSNPMGVLLSQGQDTATYDPEGLLEFSRTYYWRVDEVRAAPSNTVVRGKVWSFTVEPLAYPIADAQATASAFEEGSGPEKTVDGSGLNESDQHSIDAPDMWLAVGDGVNPVWIQYEFDRVYKLHEMLLWNYNVQFEPLLGLGIKSATLEYSENGADWMILGEVELAQGAARADYAANNIIDCGGAAAQYVRLTVNSGFGMTGQFGLSEVRFMYIPAHARGAQPADGETEVDVNTVFTWRAGRGTVSHDIYLGTDEQAVTDGTALVDTVAQAEYAPSDLKFGGTYYWKVDEVNEAEQINVWEGDLWSFMTLEFAPIDDMEDYNDQENRIYDAWLDGWTNETGSTVGYVEAPFAERTIVHRGKQSMPLAYDNSTAPFYSAIEKDLGGMNLTANGADSLRLYVSGMAPAFHENADGTILMNGVGADIWDAADRFRFAYRQLTGNGSMIVRVDDLDSSPSGWVKAGPMIRQNVAVGSMHSFMAITGGEGNGASWQGRETANANSVNADATDPITPPYWARINRAGDTLTGFLSPDGETWTQVGDPRTIAMDDPVMIGLALTSHNANQATSAVFSNVSFTGNISGAWQIAGIGATQPAGNDPQPIYVALGDAVVIHPDPAVTARFGWTEWVIPLSEFGDNLSNVPSITIGVGNPNNAGSGAGLVFIDDIGYGRPATDQ